MLVAEDDRAHRVPRVDLVGVAEEGHGAAVAEDGAQLGGREPDVEREQHPTGQQHAVVRLEQLVGVAAQPGDDVARAHAEVALQHVGEAVARAPRTRRRSTARRPATIALPFREQPPGSRQEVERREGQLHQATRPARRGGPSAPAGGRS